MILADKAEFRIEKHLGRGYRRPGNVRELEQCMRNVMILGGYRPQWRAPASLRDSVSEAVFSASLTAYELLRRYCTLVCTQAESYRETARRMALDRRTEGDQID